MKQLPIVVCIDIEPDKRLIDVGAQIDWPGFERTYEFFAELRPRLEKATGAPVHFSWFLRMDPQIAHTYGSPSWAATRYAGLFEGLRAAGDELGLHTHAWRWEEASQTWIADIGNQEWVDHCVRMAFAAFQARFDRQCTSFRFGDHWMSDATLDLVEKLGAQFDLTVEPGRKAIPGTELSEPFTGSLPDYTRVPQYPYHPSQADFRRPGSWKRRSIWILPLSAGRIEGPKAGRLRRVKRFLRFIGVDLYKHKEPLVLGGMNPSEFSQLVDNILSTQERPYLTLALRTDVGSDPMYRSNLEGSFSYLLSHPLIHRFVFDTPAEAITHLAPHPSPRH